MRAYNDRTPHRLMPLRSRHTRSRRRWQHALANPGGGEPPPPGPDYVVSGDGDPSPNGDAYYDHTDDWYHWYLITSGFWIRHYFANDEAMILNEPEGEIFWVKADPAYGIVGTYAPDMGCTGNPVVVAA